MSSYYRERHGKHDVDIDEQASPKQQHHGRRRVEGALLVGREINLRWEDGNRYEAVVVRYYDREDEYKLVYTADDGVEVACINNRDWYALKKKVSIREKPVLTGAIIKFIYPKDRKMYKAMIYHHSDNGEQLKVCYIDEHSTDAIGGRGWSFVTQSPCAYDPSSTNSRQRVLEDDDGNGTYDGADDDDDVDAVHRVKNESLPYYHGDDGGHRHSGGGSSSGNKYGLDVRRGRVSKKSYVP